MHSILIITFLHYEIQWKLSFALIFHIFNCSHCLLPNNKFALFCFILLGLPNAPRNIFEIIYIYYITG